MKISLSELSKIISLILKLSPARAHPQFITDAKNRIKIVINFELCIWKVLANTLNIIDIEAIYNSEKRW